MAFARGKLDPDGLLEELAPPFEAVPVDVFKGERHATASSAGVRRLGARTSSDGPPCYTRTVDRTAAAPLSKVPAVTIGFWVIKIAATTLGETGGDAVTMTLNLGYLIGTAIFAVLLVAAVSAQLAAKRFHPFLYWAVIIATTTVGTTLADFVDRSLGIGYLGGSLILSALVLASLGLWYRTCGSVSVASITMPKVELFYWTTILCSQTLGTALGDWLADDTGLGYERGALVFALGLALVVLLYFFSRVPKTLLFWAAFVLTRPLGATVGDLLDKPHAKGGLEIGRFTASSVLIAFIVLCIVILPQRAGEHPGNEKSP